MTRLNEMDLDFPAEKMPDGWTARQNSANAYYIESPGNHKEYVCLLERTLGGTTKFVVTPMTPAPDLPGDAPSDDLDHQEVVPDIDRAIDYALKQARRLDKTL